MKRAYFIIFMFLGNLLSAQTSTEDLFTLCNTRANYELRNLHASHININARNQNGNTPLMIAAKKHNFDAIKP